VKVLRDAVAAISAEPYSTSKHALAYQTLPLALIKLDLFMGGFSVDCRVWHAHAVFNHYGKAASALSE